MELPKIDTSNLWDKTYSILKNQIIRRQFTPNEKISIPDLADKLGVSRTPVRDALNRLEMEGLVKTVSKVGTFVVAINPQDIMDIMDTRLMLEFWVIEKLANVDPGVRQTAIANMENILLRSSQLIDADQVRDYLSADFNMAFHIEFMKIGQNQKNIDIYLKLMDYRYITMKSSIVTPDMARAAQAQHEEIIDAMKNGTIEEIRKVIRLHLEDSQNRLLKVINDHGGTI
ncbi:GntR family transcriptional regulator [Paenibacillus sp. NPDC056579]|uniref:GntR family transcriptional regulator n=1 Tax=unclassified Paenibacillus TaxID=185978 RepID=UPI001EF8C7A3|nr:GntR family transcriptional regulator [Paenibacillus sp. H1-7]ULL17172.1 GntR family transcriptional regulator [Paenibacillus sp. H1-7]